METKYTLHLTEDEIDTLIAGLRYLELHHPARDNFDIRADFKKLLNEIYLQIRQTTLFKDS